MQLFGFGSGTFREDDFVKSMPLFAAMLTASDRYRRWVVGGETASTDGDTVYLPGIKMKSAREAMAFLGFALHELGHRWTDFGILEHTTTPFLRWLTNDLEDVHTDRKQHKVHPGAKSIGDQLASYLIEEGLEVKPEASMDATDLIQCYIHYRLRCSVIGESAYAELADDAERLVAGILPVGVMTKLRALMFEVASCDDSWDVLELAKSIVTMLEDAKDEDEPPPQSDGGDGKDGEPGDGSAADGSPAGADGANAAGADGNAVSGPGSDAGSDSAQASPGAAPSNAPGDSAAVSSLGQAGQGSGGTQSAGSVGSGGDSGHASGQFGAGAGDFRAVIDELLGMSSDQAMKGIGDQLKQMVNVIAHEQLASGEFDPNLWYTPNDSVVQDDAGVSGREEMDRVNASVNALRFRLNAFLQARTRCNVAYKGSGRKLAVSRLSRLSYGDSRVFKVKSKGTDIDTAVVTLGDRSGSMDQAVGVGATRLNFALDVILALSMALDAINGVKHSVAVFPGQDEYIDGRCQTTIDVLKRWGEPTKQVVSRYNSVRPNGVTPAHIALVWAGQELLKVKAARKVIFMATDGKPDQPEAVKDAVADLRRLGVEVIGVGIGVDVGHLFDAFVRVDAIEELASAVFGMMRDRLLAA